MSKTSKLFCLSFLFAIVLIGCQKNTDTASAYKLSYGDSIFYLRNQPGDYIIFPTEARAGGRYTGFPDGIQIDNNSGAVTVSKSETGLRYKISFIDGATGDTTSTVILISGINYFDKIYNLSSNDTLAMPVYNATRSHSIPSSSVFDEGNGCNGVGVSVDINSAVINLAQTIRNGVFGPTPSNGAQKEVELKYRVNDGSNKSLNSLKVKLYYFNTANDLTPDLVQLIKDREGTVFGNLPLLSPQDGQVTVFGNASPATVNGLAKPRPPCIFIVGR